MKCDPPGIYRLDAGADFHYTRTLTPIRFVGGGARAMKNIIEVLREKEIELRRVQAEIEALRIAIRLLLEEGDSYGPSLVACGNSSEPRLQEKSTSFSATHQFP